MPNYPKYPIYQFSATWNQDGFKNKSTSFSRMYKCDPGISGARQDAIEWFERMVDSKECFDGTMLKDKNPQLISLQVKLIGNESWCLTWFSHYTHNIHLSDSELLASFDEFVGEKMLLNVHNGHHATDMVMDNKAPYYCLMGADDRWRWKGPCRCDKCVEYGVTRIDH